MIRNRSGLLATIKPGPLGGGERGTEPLARPKSCWPDTTKAWYGTADALRSGKQWTDEL